MFLGTFAANAANISICDNLANNLVLNCGFEMTAGPAGTVPTDWLGQQFTGFESVDTGNVNSGAQSMRIANDHFQAGEPLFEGAAILSQNFSDTPGELYSFTFYVLNGDPNQANEQFQAFWGSQANPTGGSPLFVDNGSAPASYVAHTFTVTGTGSDTITFTSYSSPSYYWLDDVSLVDTGVGASATAPEPGTMALLGLALCGAGLLKRRSA